MNRSFGAVVMVGLFAITGCTTGQPSGGGPASPSLTAPSTAPTRTTSPPSPPSPAASAGVASVHEGPLAAGTYTMGLLWDDCTQSPPPGCSPSPAHDAMRITFIVPDGWSGVGTEAIWLTDKGMGDPDGAGLLFGRGSWLLTDPCTKAQHAVAPDISVGSTVDDFVDAVTDHPLLDVTDPVDVTLAGYSGKYFELHVPADISMCEVYRPWDPGIFAQGPGNRWHLWILDVDGLRLVVQSGDYPGTSAKHRSELQAIVDSITIEP
jgi:hypothetical protein